MSAAPRQRLDPARRFGATVEAYRRHRPGYPEALAAWILDTAAVSPAEPVLDLGCGTGIVARLFLGHDLTVLGLDPSREMLAAARADAPAARLLCARSEAIPLRDATLALAVCGQAFHWFDTDAAIAELARVVRPGGWCAAFWNERCPDGLAGEYDRILSAHSSEYVSLRRDDDTLAGYRAALAGRELRETRLPNRQTFDLEGFLGRVRSASYFVHGVTDQAALLAELERAFQRAAPDGRGTFHYETVALMWR